MREIIRKRAFSPAVKGFAFKQTRSFLKLAFRGLAALCAIPVILSLLGCVSASSGSHGKPGKQQSLSEWRRLTEKSTAPPRVFVNHDQVRFYFWPETNVIVQFKAKVTRQRWPS